MAGRSGSRIALDSSYLIALLCDWHVHHPRTLRSYLRWLERNAQILIPLHSIFECYSVLTRMPAPYRLAPQIALQNIQESFSGSATIIAMKPHGAWDLLDELARREIRGGQVYDALIVKSAAEAGAATLLTWNAKHFAEVAPAGIEVSEP